MADDYGISPYGYGPMSASAGGPANFLSGAMPGLERGIGMLAQLPLLRYQAQQMEQQRVMKGLQSLSEVVKMPRYLRGPYVDAFTEAFPMHRALAETFKKASGDEQQTLIDLLTEAGHSPERAAQLSQFTTIEEGLKEFNSAFKKRAVERAWGEGGPKGDTGAPPSAAVPAVPAAPPPPSEAPLVEQLAGPGFEPGAPAPVAAPERAVTPPAAPSPTPAPSESSRPDLRARRTAVIKARNAELDRLTEVETNLRHAGALDADQRGALAERRQRINTRYEPILQGIDTQIAKLEPQGELAQLQEALTVAQAEGRTADVAQIQAKLRDLGLASSLGVENARATLAKAQQDLDKGLKPNPERIDTMRREVSSNARDFIHVRDAVNKALAAGNTPVGDVALMVAFLKVVDPGSVARESEQATIQNARSIPDAARQLYDKVTLGKKLDDNQVQWLRDEVRRMYGTMEATHGQMIQQYRDLAVRAGIDPRDVIIDYANPPGGATPTPTPATPASRPLTQEKKAANAEAQTKTQDAIDSLKKQLDALRGIR